MMAVEGFRSPVITKDTRIAILESKIISRDKRICKLEKAMKFYADVNNIYKVLGGLTSNNDRFTPDQLYAFCNGIGSIANKALE